MVEEVMIQFPVSIDSSEVLTTQGAIFALLGSTKEAHGLTTYQVGVADQEAEVPFPLAACSSEIGLAAP